MLSCDAGAPTLSIVVDATWRAKTRANIMSIMSKITLNLLLRDSGHYMLSLFHIPLAARS